MSTAVGHIPDATPSAFYSDVRTFAAPQSGSVSLVYAEVVRSIHGTDAGGLVGESAYATVFLRVLRGRPEIVNRSEALDHVYQQLRCLEELPSVWNEYDTPRPSHRSIERAREATRRLAERGVAAIGAGPSPEGGASLSFGSSSRYVSVEFYNDDEYVVLLSATGKPPAAITATFSESSIGALIEQLESFFDAEIA
ncbi:MAG: hypothetical protein ABI910_22370 [Gemmatimonadota bacterium]